jgi:flavodoxin I
MPRIGIFYGSTTGNTQAAADLISQAFGAEAAAPEGIFGIIPEDLIGFDLLILGSSTWGYGDLQDDWEAVLPKLDQIDLTGRKVALFGLGDQDGYPDTFVDALGIIAEKVRERGGEIVGTLDTDGYTFDSSKAVENGIFVGLPLDEDNQPEMTAPRVAAWTARLKEILG